MPQVHVLTFGVQKELFSNLSLDAGYVGKLSRHLQDTVNLNQAVFIPGTGPTEIPIPRLGTSMHAGAWSRTFIRRLTTLNQVAMQPSTRFN